MNILSRDKQIEIIATLSEGMSIWSVERLTGVHRDTIMRLGARADLVAPGCMHARPGISFVASRKSIALPAVRLAGSRRHSARLAHRNAR